MAQVTEPFTYDGGQVDPGETAHVRYDVSETYLGDSVAIPVTVVNGPNPGPTAFLVAALHGDELNGVETVREVVHEWNHDDLAGTLVCIHVLNVPGFLAHERYVPHDDSDLNRSFPGSATGSVAERMVHRVYENFIAPCDFGIDFHTSTRGRSNMSHVRADTTDEAVERLAMAFGSTVVISDRGPRGSLRRTAGDAGIPTITVEMGEAHRFQRDLINGALAGVSSVLCEYGMWPDQVVRWSGWRSVVRGRDANAWLRADDGGIVEMHAVQGSLVSEGDPICTITDPFHQEVTAVEAPFAGLIVGVLENPVVAPGNPLCHLVSIDETTRRAIEIEERRLDRWDT